MKAAAKKLYGVLNLQLQKSLLLKTLFGVVAALVLIYLGVLFYDWLTISWNEKCVMLVKGKLHDCSSLLQLLEQIQNTNFSESTTSSNEANSVFEKRQLEVDINKQVEAIKTNMSAKNLEFSQLLESNKKEIIALNEKLDNKIQTLQRDVIIYNTIVPVCMTIICSVISVVIITSIPR